MRFPSLLWVLVASACSSGNGTPTWRGDLEPGPYAVGFRTGAFTRQPDGGAARDLVLSVWFPAEEAGTGDPLTVGDLFGVVLEEGQLLEAEGLPRERAFAAAMTGDSLALSPDRSRSVLGARTLARRGAHPVLGRFPLALWSVRHATVLAQAPMAQYLASHGIVVATVWSSDPPLAFIWEDRPSAEKLATVEAHTGDLQWALARLRRDPAVDGDRVVALSWSYGGQTAARLQERDRGVRGVISLDANVLPALPEERLELRRPLVYFVGQDTTRRGLAHLSEVGAPWVLVRLPALEHGNFNALEGYLPALYEADTVYSWSRGGPVAVEGYAAVSRMVKDVVLTLAGHQALSIADLAERLSAAAGPTEAEVRTSGG